jgi:PAS domain S-box-containing protein
MDKEVVVIIEPQHAAVEALSQHLLSIGANSGALHVFTSVKQALQLNSAIYPTLVFYNSAPEENIKASTYQTLLTAWPKAKYIALYSAEYADAALDDIALGTADCLSVEDIGLLSVKKAIKIANRKHNATQQIDKKNDFFNAILNNPIQAVFFTKPDGVIVDANEGAEQMFGYSVDEIKTLTRQHLFDHTDPKLISNLKTRQQQGSTKGEIIGIRKNGQRFPCQFSSVLYKTANGEERANTIVLDITDQKIANKEREILIQSTEESFVLVDKDLKIKSFNNEFFSGYKSLFGKEVAIGEDILDYAQPARRDIVKDIYKNVFEGKVIEDDITVTHLGKTVIYATRYKPVYDDEGQLYGAFVISTDITKKRMVDEQLKVNEKRFRSLIENSEDIIMLMGVDRLVTYISPSFTKILGYTEEEILGKRPIQFTHPDYTEATLKVSGEALANPGKKLTYSSKVKKKNGDYIFVEGTVINQLHIEGVNALVNNFIDVTPQHIARQELLASQRRFKALVENSGDAVVILTIEGEITYSSPSVFKMLGYSDEEVKALNIMSVLHPDDVGGIGDVLEKAMQNPGVTIPGHLGRVKHKNGSWRWCEATVTSMLHDDAIGGIVDNFRDVTERVEAEQKAIETNNLLKKLTNKLPAAIYQYEIDADGNMTFPFMSQGITDIIPWVTVENIMERPASLFSHLHPDDAGDFMASIELSKQNLTDWDIEFRAIVEDDKIIWLKGTSRPERKPNGATVWYGYLEDITYTKLADDITKQNELRYRTLFDFSPTPMFTYDDTTYEFVQINKAALKFYGYTETEMRKLNVLNMRPDYNIPETEKNIQEKRSSDSYNVQTVHQKKDGSIANVQVYNNKIIVDGKTLRLAQVTDLTSVLQIKKEREIAERAFKYLTESKTLNEGLNKVLQDITVAVGWDLAEIWIPEYNNEYIKLIASGVHPLYAELENFVKESGNYRAKFGESVPSSAITTGRPVWISDLQATEKFKRKELAEKHGLKSGVLIPLKQADECVAELFLFSTKVEKEDRSLVNLLEGIGTHIAAEIILRKSKEELNLLFEFSPDILCVVGYDGYFKKVNPAFSQITGYSTQELLGKPYNDFIHPDDINKAAKEIENKYTGLSVFYSENRYITKDGDIKWLSWTSAPFEDGELIYAVAKDVTDKKKDEQLLQQYNTRLENAQQIASLGYWEFDYANDVIYWTDEVYRIFGVEKDAFHNTYNDFYKLIHPDDRKLFDIQYETLLAEKKSGAIEHRILRPDGSIRYVYQQIGLLFGPNNTLLRIEGTVQDVTGRKQQEEALRILNEQIQHRAEELAASNAELRKIAWMQSHLVRAPLARILGLVEILEDDLGDNSEIVSNIKQSSVELDTIIRDIVSRTDVVKTNS